MRISILVGLAGLVVATNAAAQDVTWDYATGTDFTRLRTYAWIVGPRRIDPLNDQPIVSAIEDQLRNFALDEFGTGWGGYRFGETWTNRARLKHIVVGSLMVDIVEATSRTIIWRGLASNDIDIHTNQVVARSGSTRRWKGYSGTTRALRKTREPVPRQVNGAPMRLRTYYTCAILAPLVILAVVAAAGGDGGSSTLGLGPGATVRSLYPRSAIRDLVAGTVVCSWLLWKLYRRPLAEFHQAVWRAPVFMLVLLTLLPVVVVLVNGLARRMFSEHGPLIVLRLLVRLVMGFGYVGLIEWVRQQLQIRETLRAEVAAHGGQPISW